MQRHIVSQKVVQCLRQQNDAVIAGSAVAEGSRHQWRRLLRLKAILPFHDSSCQEPGSAVLKGIWRIWYEPTGIEGSPGHRRVGCQQGQSRRPNRP